MKIKTHVKVVGIGLNDWSKRTDAESGCQGKPWIRPIEAAVRNHLRSISKVSSMDASTIFIAAKFALLACCLMCAGAMHAAAQGDPEHRHSPDADRARIAQVVALDECDPSTFNEATGPDFCKNVALAALGFATTLQDLFTKAANGTPDPGWDFEPDTLKIKEGTTVVVTNQGGEPHTFTEVTTFGGGFISGLNGGEETIPECSGGFKRVEVAKTRIIQGSDLRVTDLSKGEHRFQCCIHPWMRMKVEVK